MKSASKLINADADSFDGSSSSKRQRPNTHVAFYALPPALVDALHLLRNICACCIGAADVQVNELGIYNAYGLLDIVSSHLQAAPLNDSYLGEYVLIKEIDTWSCVRAEVLIELCVAIIVHCPLHQLERILKLMLRSSFKQGEGGTQAAVRAVALHQAFAVACSIAPYATFSAVMKSPDFHHIRSSVITEHDHLLLEAARLRSQRHRRSNCTLRSIAALFSVKVAPHIISFQFGTIGISRVLRDLLGRTPFVPSQPVDPFGFLPCSGCLDLSKHTDTAPHYSHSMLFCVWRLVRKCCTILWNTFAPDALSSAEQCAHHGGYHALNLLSDALVALISASDDDHRLIQLLKEMEQFSASVSSTSRLALISLCVQLLHHQKKRFSHECLQLLLCLNTTSPCSAACTCGYPLIDKAPIFLSNHLSKTGFAVRGIDIDAATASAGWTTDPAALSLVIEASLLPAVSEQSSDLPVYHIFDCFIRNAATAVLSRFPVGCIWIFESAPLNATLFTSLSLQFRCVFLQKYSLIHYLSQAKALQRQSDLLKPESIFQLADIVVVALRSMPASSICFLHKLTAELANPALATPILRYFDIFSFRLLPIVLRANCSFLLLSIVSSRMKGLLGNIHGQQYPVFFRVLNDFVVAIAQSSSEPVELPEDIWELLPETSCHIIIRCMSLTSECSLSSAALKVPCSVASHLRRLSAVNRMRDSSLSSWGRISLQLCQPFRSAFGSDKKINSEDSNVVPAEEEICKAMSSSSLSTPQRVVYWLREKKHSVLKLKTLFVCVFNITLRSPEPPSRVVFDNAVWRDALLTWVHCLSTATECSQACFSLVAYVASKTPRPGHPAPYEPSAVVRVLDYIVWEACFAPFHDILVAICDCDHECSIEWLLYLLRPGCRLELACMAYASSVFSDAPPLSAFDQNSLFTRRGAPDMWMLPCHRAALDAADMCMPPNTPVADFVNLSSSYRLFHSWPACALPCITHVIISLIQREMWKHCTAICERYRYLFLCCSTPIASSRRLLSAALNRGAPLETCIAISGLAWGMASSLPASMPRALVAARAGSMTDADVSALVCFAVDCVQPLLQHSRDDDSLIAAAFGDAEKLCMMREHLDPRTCTAAVGSTMFALAYAADRLSWHRLLLNGFADATSVGFLIASLPITCASTAVSDLLRPGQPPSELVVHVCAALMSSTRSIALAQRIIILATVQLHCAISTGSSWGALMSTRLVTCIPSDLHREAAVSELLWSFFSSLVDGCSRWSLPGAPPRNSTSSCHRDAHQALNISSDAFAPKSFGVASEGQFHCAPSQSGVSTVSLVAAALALHPNLGLAYDMFSSIVLDGGQLPKCSSALFSSLSGAAKAFLQFLGAASQ